MNTFIKPTLISLMIAGLLTACGKNDSAGNTAPAGAAVAPAQASTGNTANATNAAAGNTGAAAPGEKIILNVELIQPTEKTLEQALQANGSVHAWQEAQISAEVTGLRLTQVKAQIGDRVKKGDTLATLNKETVQADLEQAAAMEKEAQATNEIASTEAQRVRQLKDTGAYSAQQVTQILAQEKSAEARLLSARANLRQQQLRLQKTDIVAPDDGIISASMATVGAVAQPSQELFRMIRQGRLEWRAEVTATELSKLKNGQTVRLQIDGQPAVSSTVRTVAPTVDRQTRNALVYVDMPEAARNAVRAGQFINGQFVLGTRKALMVPQEATLLRDGFMWVFVAREVSAQQTAKLAQIKVETGQRDGNLVEVVSGLSAGDQLVLSGVAFLNDGDVVRVVKP